MKVPVLVEDWLMIVFLTHLAATLLMTGIIWFVQIVHYPLFNKVHNSHIAQYATQHAHLTSLVVAGPMLVELVTALFLLLFRPVWIPVAAGWLGLFLLALIWLATAFFSIPQHHVLQTGYNEKAYRFLVRSNWVRTLCWSLRSILVLWVLFGILKNSL